MLFLLVFYLTSRKGHDRETLWFVSGGIFWFGLLAIACFRPRTRKLKSPDELAAFPLEPSSELLSVESTSGSVQRVARLGDRIIAAVLDGVLVLPVFGIMMGLTAHYYHIQADEGGTITLHGGPALFVMLVSTVLWCVYYFLAEWLVGRTLGKEIMGIKVLACNGKKCGPRQAFIRNSLRPVDAFGFYLVGFVAALLSPTNQSIGDRTAGTIPRENPLARRKLAFLLWLIVLVGFGGGSYSLLRFFQH
jgi:uncharacterized RDD family membrane protein YckC